eukprot:TRINITY_DN4293_c0_g1_i7.p1 TRINITY_DN4293_c0_g1~~TRINITY_DN4293_c0_g1_i7.p1  ORF type:complete len:472 (+),score=44.59 TRINITY_DN4293_c0_g1_i7:203-1417(+)
MVISKPDAHGNVFMRQLPSGDSFAEYAQLFRVQNDLVQYCFFDGALEAPFQISSSSTDEVVLCWRGPRLPTHASGCGGCDCAQWVLRLNGDTLQSTFHMSPPALHMQSILTRSGSAPSAEKVSAGWPCEFNNHTGRPLRDNRANPKQGGGDARGLCAAGFGSALKHPSEQAPFTKRDASGQVRDCVVLNKDEDVRLEYVASSLPCEPCNVTFTISADTQARNAQTRYLAVGFKGSAAAYFEAPLVSELPQYWGMASGEAEHNYSVLSGRIVLGYVGGSSCVRQLIANKYIGSVIEADHDELIQNSKVQSVGGRTSVTFTASLHAGYTASDLDWRKYSFIGNLRVMYAIGSISGDGGCSAPLGYHSSSRGLANLNFPGLRYECDARVHERATSSGMLDSDTLVHV